MRYMLQSGTSTTFPVLGTPGYHGLGQALRIKAGLSCAVTDLSLLMPGSTEKENDLGEGTAWGVD